MELHNIPPLFGIKGECSVVPLSSGHINSTYKVTAEGSEYILQSLNSQVFRAPEAVMGNIAAIESAFAGAESVCVPEFLTSGGRNFAGYGGEIWRMYTYIEAGESSGSSPYSCGYAFGAFIRLTGGIRLEPVIGGYHSYSAYLRRLTALAGSGLCPIDSGAVSRLNTLGEELSAVFTPELPMRNIHGDAKTDNVIVGERLTVIDLDTAMKGYAALDCGDLIRSVSRGGGPGLNRINAATKGFADGLEGILTSEETDSLYYGILWSAGELAVRYLTDSISGDRYFRDKTPEECRERADELLGQLGWFMDNGRDIADIIRGSFRKTR